MLQNSHSFFSLPTASLQDSYHFYKEVLELEVDMAGDHFLHVRLPGGSLLVIYQKDYYQPGQHTTLNFQITDIEKIVDHLTRKGVEFLQYEKPFKTDAKGISWDDQGSHIAWFKDPGNNIIALIEN